MPWRVSPSECAAGVRPDPYQIWLSEVMLQQTTVAMVKAYFTRFTQRWPLVQDLARAQDAEVMAEWAGLGYYARARNLLACARAVTQFYGGQFPANHAALLTLPGIGPYTAAAISAIAFNLPETVLDGNVERVMARLFAVTEPLPTAKPHLFALAESQTPQARAGDYAQELMDLGATVCKPRTPSCEICPLAALCDARAQGIAANLPKKLVEAPKPTRTGRLWVARRKDGAWLLEERRPKGLLGGMLGWPGSDWDNVKAPPPFETNWQKAGVFRHTFTHFHADMEVLTAQVGQADPKRGAFVAHNLFQPDDLPTLMRKAYDLAILV